MIPVTGCISIGTRDGSAISIDRVIECVHIDREARSCTICVDLFIHNTSPKGQHLRVLHRGNLHCTDVTRESWTIAEHAIPTWPQVLADRVVRLRQDLSPFEGGVRLAELDYRLWEGPDGSIPMILGSESDDDVPYTMWEIGPFAPGERRVARLQLEMARASYQKQIGDAREFYAYGDAILLDTIEYQDVPNYKGDDWAQYRAALRELRRSHITPAIFEWLLVSPDNHPLPWKTKILSANFSPQVISDDYSATTQWFIARYAQAGDFRVRSELSNAFALRVEVPQKGVACEEPTRGTDSPILFPVRGTGSNYPASHLPPELRPGN